MNLLEAPRTASEDRVKGSQVEIGDGFEKWTAFGSSPPHAPDFVPSPDFKRTQCRRVNPGQSFPMDLINLICAIFSFGS
jgi:hypothetical protein